MRLSNNTDTSNEATPHEPPSHSLNIVIIGGGIVCCIIVLGLLRREFRVTIYEQGRSFREIDAGLAFATNAQTHLSLIKPDVLTAMKTVSVENELEYYNYVDGYHAMSNSPEDMREAPLFRLHAGKTGFDGCHRAYFLDDSIKLIPKGLIKFQRQLKRISEGIEEEEILLEFIDESRATTNEGSFSLLTTQQ